MDFRCGAREALARAKQELSAQEDRRLRYAALELRLAIEGLTYSRCELFKEEISPDSYSVWQPRKLIQLLLDIDPAAFRTSTAVGEETEPGKPPTNMRVLGTDTVLTLDDVKAHYDALGSFLHLPTIKQAERGGGVDCAKLRKRCEALVSILEAVLSSKIWNAYFTVTTKIDCHRCGKQIARHAPAEGKSREVSCFECNAQYSISGIAGGKAYWDSHSRDYRCPTKGCDETILIWQDEMERGTCWKCEGCGKRYRLDLAPVPDEEKTRSITPPACARTKCSPPSAISRRPASTGS